MLKMFVGFVIFAALTALLIFKGASGSDVTSARNNDAANLPAEAVSSSTAGDAVQAK